MSVCYRRAERHKTRVYAVPQYRPVPVCVRLDTKYSSLIECLALIVMNPIPVSYRPNA